MPITPAHISAGASALSAISGAFGKSKRGPSLQDQYDAAKKHAQHMALDLPLSQKLGWEKAGIHPIYGMGGSSSQFSPAVTAFDNNKKSVGSRLQEAGVGISRAAEALSMERERLQNRMLNTQIKGQEIENQKKASDLVVATTGAPPGLPASYQFQRNQPVPMRYLPMINPDGSITSVTNPEAGDNEFLMAYDFLTKTMPDEVKNSARRDYKKFKRFAKPVYNKAKSHVKRALNNWRDFKKGRR